MPNLSSQEALNRVQSIEDHLVELLSFVSSNTDLYIELNNAHISLIKSRHLLQNSGTFAPFSFEPVNDKEGKQ